MPICRLAAQHVRRLSLLLVSALLATLAIAVAPLATPAAHADAVQGAPISRGEVVERARNWLAENVPYSQSAYHADPNNEQGEGNATYRTDCSGFVSMAWHLSSSLTTETLPNVSTKISKSDLQPGDILDNVSSHTVLFVSWANDSHTQFNLIEESNPTDDMNSYAADLSAYSSYSAYRYNKIINDGDATEDTTVSVDKCSSFQSYDISLANIRNLDVDVRACVTRLSSTRARAAIDVRWSPHSGSEPLNLNRLDFFHAYAQLQGDNVTKVEFECGLATEMDNNASGERYCYGGNDVDISAKSWTADGFIAWNKNGDGGFQGPFYILGSGGV